MLQQLVEGLAAVAQFVVCTMVWSFLLFHLGRIALLLATRGTLSACRR